MDIIHVYDAKLILVIEVGRMVLVEVAKYLSLQHPDSTSTDPNIALAEIFNNKPSVHIDSLNYSVNQSKVSNSRIEIQKLDVSTLATTLLNKKLGLLEDLELCCNGKPSKSCKHPHGCVGGVCKKAECIMLPCKHCGKDAKDCKRMIYWKCVNTIKITRNRNNHSTIEDYQNFENKTKFFSKDFPSARTWLDLWTIINDALEPCIDLLHTEKRITKDTLEDMKLDMQIALRKNPLTLFAAFTTLTNERESMKHFIETQINKLQELIKQPVKHEGEQAATTLDGDPTGTRQSSDCELFVLDDEIVRVEKKDLRNIVSFEKIPHGVAVQLPADVAEFYVLQIKILPNEEEPDDGVHCGNEWVTGGEKSVTCGKWENVATKDIVFVDGELTIKNLKKECQDFLVLLGDADDQRSAFCMNNVRIVDQENLPHISNNHTKTVAAICHSYGLPTDLHEAIDRANPEDMHSICLDNFSYVKGSGTVRGKLSEASSYLRDNFKEQQLICFPEIENIKMNKHVQKLAEKIRNYYAENGKETTSVLFTQYDSQKHFKIAGIDAAKFGIDLGANDAGNSCSKNRGKNGAKSTGKSRANNAGKNCAKKNGGNRILVMDEALQAIINIRVSDSDTAANLKKEFKCCHEDLKSVHFLHSDLLESTKVCLLPLVAACNVSQETRKNCFCDTCSDLILFEEQLDDDKMFQQFWEKNVNKRIREVLDSPQMKLQSRNAETRKSFLRIANRIMVITSLNEAFLPSAFGTDHEKIETLLLNSVQKKAIAENYTRKLIIGSYGSGKSLILQKILQHAFEDTEVEGVIYAITWDEYSLMFAELQSFCEHLKKTMSRQPPTTFHAPTTFQAPTTTQPPPTTTPAATTSQAPTASQSPTISRLLCTNIVDLSEEKKDTKSLLSLPEVLELLANKHKTSPTKIHVFVEEFDPESVSELEVDRLNEILETDAYKDSFFILTIQSLSKERKSVVDSSSLFGILKREVSVDHKTNNMDNLKGIQKYELPTTMRFTKTAHDLVTMSQDLISTKENVYAQPMVKKKSRNSRNDKNPVSGPTSTTRNPVSHSSGTTPTSQSDPAKKLDIPLKLDKLGKLLAQGQQQEYTQLGQNFIKTSFKFVGNQGCGHGIAGAIPFIVRLPGKYKSPTVEGINVMASVLRQILPKMDCSLFVCNDSLIATLIRTSLEILHVKVLDYLHNLRRKYPESQYKIDTYNTWKTEVNIVLLTENRGACGLQHDKVFYFVDEEDSHEYYLLPEAISRTTSNLAIVSFQCSSTRQQQNKQRRRSPMNAYCARDVLEEFLSKKVIENKPFDQFTVTTFKESEDLSLLFKDNTVGGVDEGIDATQAWERMKNHIAQKNSEYLTYEQQMQNRTLQELKGHLQNKRFCKFNDLIRLDKNRVILRDSYRRSLLHIAAASEATECIDGLIASGCSVKDRDNYGYLPLHYAAEQNRLQVAEKLLADNTDTINAICRLEETPLHKAAYKNHIEMVKFLLRCPTINSRTKNWENSYPEEWTSNTEIKDLIRQHYNNIVVVPPPDRN